MALSAFAKQLLDRAIAQANKEGEHVFGFIVDDEQTEIQPFGNSTESIEDFISNIDAGVSTLREAYLAKNEA